MAVDALRLLNQTLEKRVAQSTADRNRMWTLSTDVMMVAGLDGTINSVNPAWTHLLGWQEVGADRRQRHGLRRSRGARRRCRPSCDALSRGTAPKLIELSMRTGDGASRRIEWSAVAADNLLQAVGRDVTAEREAEEALRKAEEALRHSQKMEAIGQLTGGIAHDFNNMLTAIIGSMEVLKRRIRAGRYDDVQSFMDGAISAANRAAAPHPPAARLRPAPAARSQGGRRQPADPRHGGPAAAHPGRKDQAGGRPRTGAWPALTDAHQLENAILNLAINARDAMPQGGTLTIATDERKSSRAEGTVRPGRRSTPATTPWSASATPASACRRDTLAKVFEPFFTTKPIGQGTGLGLSMIYGFAKQSRGHVRVESAEGAGHDLQAVPAALPGQRRDESRLRRRATPPPASGETVLVIEDDSAVRLIISDVLRDLGYACIEAERRPGRAAHADLEHAARPADHRRRACPA